MANSKKTRASWFVGATYGSGADQTAVFLQNGIWKNGYSDRYKELVNAMRPGDRIAIKASYTRKHDLPFDNRGHSVSVLAIKAVGTITENQGDGRTVHVEWAPVSPVREWYFYTHRGTIWRVEPGDWRTDGLLAFTFKNVPQDIKRFCNAPYWRERFGPPPSGPRFLWTKFYEAVEEKLLTFRDKRPALVAGIHEIAARVDGMSYLQDNFPDGTSGPLQDICPFTVLGTFNRRVTDTNRKNIAAELAKLLGITEPVPDLFEGVPTLNNQSSWFFSFATNRQADDIDRLWDVFAAADRLVRAGDDEAEARSTFAAAYTRAIARQGVAWNLTIGLYWAHPWYFPTLDSISRSFLRYMLAIEIPATSLKGTCTATEYLDLMTTLEQRFSSEQYPVHSYPELSFVARKSKEPLDFGDDEHLLYDLPQQNSEPLITPYSIEDILRDGCFLTLAQLDKLRMVLLTQKNLILQGAPGTGKTWLARRLAYAVVGRRDDRRVRPVQFHPNLSYEDFVRGFRPGGDGQLTLVDGIFMEMVTAAARDDTSPFVVVIEEINRGNPAQIFGEMLTLLEKDKRNPADGLALCYRHHDGERVFIPKNLYVIGTMNLADRSLALIDLALRRRFAFADLEPQLGPAWQEWVKRCGLDAKLATEIERRMQTLNTTIAADARLGRNFRIGHSYVTPAANEKIEDARGWWLQQVETQLGPLLDELWIDAPDSAREARKRLIEGL